MKPFPEKSQVCPRGRRILGNIGSPQSYGSTASNPLALSEMGWNSNISGQRPLYPSKLVFTRPAKCHLSCWTLTPNFVGPCASNHCIATDIATTLRTIYRIGSFSHELSSQPAGNALTFVVEEVARLHLLHHTWKSRRWTAWLCRISFILMDDWFYWVGQ